MTLKGFSLAELMVVIIILGVLATIAYPLYIRTVEKTREQEAVTALNLIYSAEKMYRLENGDYYPNTARIRDVDSINDNLRLELKESLWDYTLYYGSGNPYATAQRQNPPSGYERILRIDYDTGDIICQSGDCLTLD